MELQSINGTNKIKSTDSSSTLELLAGDDLSTYDNVELKVGTPDYVSVTTAEILSINGKHVTFHLNSALNSGTYVVELHLTKAGKTVIAPRIKELKLEIKEGL